MIVRHQPHINIYCVSTRVRRFRRFRWRSLCSIQWVTTAPLPTSPSLSPSPHRNYPHPSPHIPLPWATPLLPISTEPCTTPRQHLGRGGEQNGTPDRISRWLNIPPPCTPPSRLCSCSGHIIPQLPLCVHNFHACINVQHVTTISHPHRREQEKHRPTDSSLSSKPPYPLSPPPAPRPQDPLSPRMFV